MVKLEDFKDKKYNKTKNEMLDDLEYHLNVTHNIYQHLINHIKDNKITDDIDFIEFNTKYEKFDITTKLQLIDKIVSST